MAKRPPPADPPRSPTLGDLFAAKGIVAGDAPEPAPKAADTLDFGGTTKIVLRRERKCRGGKTATVVEGLRLPPSALERIARELRRALGCGASVDAGTVVVQGDMAERIAPWLTARGAKRVVVGN